MNSCNWNNFGSPVIATGATLSFTDYSLIDPWQLRMETAVRIVGKKTGMNSMKLKNTLCGLALLMLVLAGGATASAQVVTNSADSGPGTLRSAITNAASGAVITFDPSLSGATITLSNTLTINTNLTIDASALPGGLQINGNGSVQIFNVASNITVFLNSLTITNGFAHQRRGH